MLRRARSLLTVPLVLLAIAAVAAFGLTSAFSAPPAPPPDVAQGGTGGAGGSDGASGTGGDPTPSGGDQPSVDPNVPDDARTGYYIRVFIDEQVVRVYRDGQEVRSMVCSSGTEEKPTPTGRFYIQNRGESFFSEKYQQGGLWWVSFKDWGIYLFHSVPTDKNGNFIPEEAAKLGQRASHGCIRLAVEDARWIYDNIPEGVPVDIG